MAEFIQYINLILTLLAFGIIGLLWKALKAQKETIEAQKSIVDSFKAQHDTLKSTHEMWLNQIKDETFHNAVNYQVREIDLKHKADIKELKESDKHVRKKAQELLAENIQYKSAFNRLVVMTSAFKILNEPLFELTADQIHLQKLELDAMDMHRKKLRDVRLKLIRNSGDIITIKKT